MSALTSLLARDQVVAVRKIEEALQRQVIRGGGIELVLLEMDAVAEDTLASYHAALLSGLPATRAEVMGASRDMVRLVPREVAERHRLVPLFVDAKELFVAVSSPLAQEVRAQLGFLLGYEIVPRYVTDVRISAALHQHYGTALSPREEKVVEQLRARDAGALVQVSIEPPSEALREAPAASASATPEGPDLWGSMDEGMRTQTPVTLVGLPVLSPAPALLGGEATRASAAGEMQTGGAVSASLAVRSDAVAVANSKPASVPAPPVIARLVTDTIPAPPAFESRRRSERVRKRRGGDLVLATAIEQLDRATHRDDIVATLLTFAGQVFDYVVLFGVSGDLLEGKESRGKGLSTEDVKRIAWPLDVPSSFSEVRRLGEPMIVSLTGMGFDAVAARDLRRDRAQPAMLLPIRIRERVVLMVYGDRDGEVFAPADVADLRALIPEVVRTFERLILSKKKGGAAESSGKLPAGFVQAAARHRVSERPAAAETSAPGEGGELRAESEGGELRAPGEETPERVAPDTSGAPSATAAVFETATTGTGDAAVSPLAPHGGARQEPSADAGHASPVASFVAAVENAPRPRPPSSSSLTRAVIGAPNRAPRDVLGVPRTAPPPPIPVGETGRDAASHDTVPSNELTPIANQVLAEAARTPSGPAAAASSASAETEPDVRFARELTEELAVPVDAAPANASETNEPVVVGGILPASAEPAPLGQGAPLGGSDSSDPDDLMTGRPGVIVRSPGVHDLDAPLGGEQRAPGIDALQPYVPTLSSPISPSSAPPPPQKPPPAFALRFTKNVPREAGLHVGDSTTTDVVGRTRVSSPPGARTSTPPPSAQLETPALGVDRDSIPTPANGIARPKRIDPRRDEDGGTSRPVTDVVQVRDLPAAPIVPIREERRRSVVPVRPSEPKVIVDMGENVARLVRDAMRSAPDDEQGAVDALVRLGEVVLPAVVQAFPGPLWFDRHQPHKRLPRGRDVSAMARTLVAFRERSVPYLAPLLDHADPDIRFYSTLVSSEMPHPRLIEPLGRRIFDEDSGTRTLALDVLRLVRHFNEFHDVLEHVRAQARIQSPDVRPRRVAVKALGELRDRGALDLLVQLLEDEDADLRTAVRQALVVLTRQDFEQSHRKWAAWAERNGKRHRVEWLIDALLHDDENIRAEAGDELQRMTQEYLGFHPSLPRRDREHIQRRYLTWWEQEGRRRFTT